MDLNLFSSFNCYNGIKNWTEKWERYIRALIKTVDRYPLYSYSIVACTVQSEWIFLQHVTKDILQAFKGLGKVLWGKICLVFSLKEKKTFLQL